LTRYQKGKETERGFKPPAKKGEEIIHHSKSKRWGKAKEFQKTRRREEES